jgi:hypothetical protein
MRAGINKPDPVSGPAKSEVGAWKWAPGEPSDDGTTSAVVSGGRMLP